MTINGLKYIAAQLDSAKIPYCFEEWSKELQYPYFVGEYTETEPLNEDGRVRKRIYSDRHNKRRLVKS